MNELEREIKKLITSDQELNRLDQLAQSIPGIGPISSWYMIATTNRFTYFKNAREYACYCGVAPFSKSSGSSIKHKDKTDKRSNRKFNGIITMAARSAAQHNPEIRLYMDRKIKEGKAYGCVLNAVKNKLIARVFAVIHHNTPYVDVNKFAA